MPADMSAQPTNKRFATSALSVLLARFIACISAFGFTALLAQRLTPAEFGSFVLLFSLASLATLLGSLGMNRAVVKRIAEANNTETQHYIMRRSVLLAIPGGMFAGLASYGLLSFFQDRLSIQSELAPTLFGAIVFFRTLHLVLAESARGFHEKAWSNMFGGPTGGPIPHLLFLIALGAFVYWNDCTLASALILYLASFAITLPLLAWRVFSMQGTATDSIATAPNAEAFSSFMALSLPLMLTQVGSLAMSQADIWLAGGLISPEELAIYGAAQRLLAFLTIPLQIAGTAIVSYIPELHSRGDRSGLQSMVSLAASVAGAPGIVLGLVFLLFPQLILGTIFGDYYAAGSLVLIILAAGQIVCILTGPCEMLLMMVGHHRKALVVNTIATTALFIVAPFATRMWGVTGLATSMASVTATQNLVNCYLAFCFTGVNTSFSIQPLTNALETLRARRGAGSLS